MENLEKSIPDEKKLKQLEKTFKSMGPASSAALVLEPALLAFELLQPIFDVLAPALQIIGGLFSAMAGGITMELMPVMEPLFEALIELMPFFLELGKTIGQLIATALVPLIPLFVEIIKLILQVAETALPILIEMFMHIVEVVLTVLKPILTWLASLSPAELGRVIYVFGLGLSALYGLLHGGPWIAALYAGLWAGFMSPLLAMQKGGITTETTPALLHGKEAVIPLEEGGDYLGNRDLLQESIWTTEDTNKKLDILIYETRMVNRRRRGGIR